MSLLDFTGYVKTTCAPGSNLPGSYMRALRYVNEMLHSYVHKYASLPPVWEIESVGYRVNSVLGVKFRIWATQVLKAYLLKGYAVNARLNLLEDKMDRRLAKHDADIVELKDKVDFFVRTSQPPVQGVFYNGQVFDARVFATKHILSANLHAT